MKYSVTYYTPNCNIHCLYFNYMQTVCFGTVYYPICTVENMDRWITSNGEMMKKCRIPLCFSTQMLQKHRKTNKQIIYLGIYFFKPTKVIFKQFSRKKNDKFQGRLENQAVFKTVFKFKHFSRSVRKPCH